MLSSIDNIAVRLNDLHEYLGNRRSFSPNEVSHLNPPSNQEQGLLELRDFIRDKPKKYTGYLVKQDNGYIIASWPGLILATVVQISWFPKPGHGSAKHGYYLAHGVNGITYIGHHNDVGLWCTMRARD